MDHSKATNAIASPKSSPEPNRPSKAERQGTRVVLIDDDDMFRESLGLNLSDEGFDVVQFVDGPSGLMFFSSGNGADIVLLDWRMPDMDGLEVLRRLRKGGHGVPVVFITVLSDNVYEEAALEGGAVDFIEKSRSFPVLLQRIRLITEGAKTIGGEDAILRRGDLDLRLDSCRAEWKGAQVNLTLTEFHIVHLFCTRAGADVSYRQIYDIVHGEEFVAGQGAEGYRANVRAFITRIRQKFQKIDPEFTHIENYPGFGYRWRED